jgi:hypothetical protein
VRESRERNNCRSAPLGVTSAPSDRTAPTFNGLEQATACTPGPTREGGTTTYHLGWQAASDDRTPAQSIVYEIFQTTAAGAEDFDHPTYVTRRGATTFTTPALTSDRGYYFVVRARDAADNRDSNRLERMGQDVCV